VNGENVPIRFSLGSAEYRRGIQSDELLADADKALYADKQARTNPIPAEVTA
jgi:GGDEF domain-containing protein